MFHYTHAIKLDPQNYSLYSNRSFAFLMMRQYHYAMEDALMTIQLKPDWSKVFLAPILSSKLCKLCIRKDKYICTSYMKYHQLLFLKI